MLILEDDEKGIRRIVETFRKCKPSQKVQEFYDKLAKESLKPAEPVDGQRSTD